MFGSKAVTTKVLAGLALAGLLFAGGAVLAQQATGGDAARIERFKAAVVEGVESRRKLSQVMNDTVFSYGELAYQEFETSKYLTDVLEKNGFSVEQSLILNLKVPKEDVGRSLSEFYRVPFLAYSAGYVPPVEYLEKFTVDYLKHHSFVPVAKAGNRATVLMANPRNLQLRDMFYGDIGRAALGEPQRVPGR